MKIKINQIYKKFGLASSGSAINLERSSTNTIHISTPGEIPVDILLPEDFDLEVEAAQQLIEFAHLKTGKGRAMKCACATPDFHKGSPIPVGSIVVSAHSIVIPQAIGSDINCGMRMHKTGLNLAEFLNHKTKIIEVLKGDLLGSTRDIPTTGKAMAELFDSGLAGFWGEMKKTSKEKGAQGIFKNIDWNRLEMELGRMHKSAHLMGDKNYAPENLMNRVNLRDPSLATLGGGNHFFEFQVIKEINDRQKAYELGLKVGDVVYMIHTGSRDVGFYVGGQWRDIARQEWPKELKHPKNKIFAIDDEIKSNQYLKAMQSAAHYANANRALLAEIARQRINSVCARDLDNMLITDVPHNICIREDIGNVHRKGATPAYEGDLLLIPGSMGHDSYLLSGMGEDKWLQSASHGAGRKVSRGEISFKSKKDKSILGLDGVECITLKEERMIEEAPGAYKEIGPVIDSQISEGVIKGVAVMSPLITFKA